MKPLFSFLMSSSGIVKGCLVAFVGLMVLPHSLAGSAELVFPAKEWREQAPSDQGMNAEVLSALSSKIGGRGLIIRNGYIVHSWGELQRRGDLYSASNPLFSTLLFFAIEEGRVGGVRESVADYYWDLDSKDQGINFWQLMNMTSGYSRPEPAGDAWEFNQFGVQLQQEVLVFLNQTF